MIVSDELEMMWKEVVVAQFKVLLRIDPLLDKELETNNAYSRCYAIGE
jgi:hypothetical protein